MESIGTVLNAGSRSHVYVQVYVQVYIIRMIYYT